MDKNLSMCFQFSKRGKITAGIYRLKLGCELVTNIRPKRTSRIKDLKQRNLMPAVHRGKTKSNFLLLTQGHLELSFGMSFKLNR